MTRWEIDYVGLFSGATVGPIAFDDSVSEQELDFQQFYITTVLNPGSPPTIPAFSTYLVGSITSVIRSDQIGRESRNRRRTSWIQYGDRKSTRLNSSHQIISYAV